MTLRDSRSVSAQGHALPLCSHPTGVSTERVSVCLAARSTTHSSASLAPPASGGASGDAAHRIYHPS